MAIVSLQAFESKSTVNVVVESPRGSTVKLKYDEKHDVIQLSRPLIDGLAFPFDWGFVPGTRAEDGDPVDALVFWSRASFPGVVIACRLIAVLNVEQNSKTRPGTRERNDRLVAVPVKAPALASLADVSDIEPLVRQELESFLIAASAFENKDLTFLGWEPAAAAYARVNAAISSPRP